MTTPALSIVICTHNPRADYLDRTLAGLRAQTLPASAWELIVVDNASRPPLASRLDLTWHPAGRVIAEPELGLTAARLRGIGAARADLLVFVDDDNLLAPDYLVRAAALAAAWPMLGVWGCGNYTPEWEVAPAPSLGELIRYLAVHRAPRDRWSNQPFDYAATPAGAGLCARAGVARRYAENVRHDPRRKLLGRTGGNLAGCEDFDLALTAVDLGLGTGVFTELAMIHLMPRERVEESYLLRLVEGHACSIVILQSLRDPGFSVPRTGLLGRVRHWRYLRTLSPSTRAVQEALSRGEARAGAELARLSPS